LLDQLILAGIRHAVLCTGYKADMVEAALGPTHGPLRLSYSRETAPLGTGGALRHALPQLNSDPILVLNGDSYCQADYSAFLQFHQSHMASLLLSHVPDVSRFGQVLTDAQGRITQFTEKSAPAMPTVPGWINVGIYLLSHGFIETIPPARPVSLETEVFPAAIPNSLYAFPVRAPFIDIGTPDSYAAAEAFFSPPAPA
jgi:NDP-sugar pyrophosphorylase family protein